MFLAVFSDSFDICTTQDKVWSPPLASWPQARSCNAGGCLEQWLLFLSSRSFCGENGYFDHLHYATLQPPRFVVVHCSFPRPV